MKTDKRIIENCWNIESRIIGTKSFVITFKGENSRGNVVSFEVKMTYYMFKELISGHIRKARKQFLERFSAKYHELKTLVLD